MEEEMKTKMNTENKTLSSGIQHDKTLTHVRHLGFFGFYNEDRGYGFIETNGLLFNKEDMLIGIFVLYNENRSFREGDWVTFEVGETSRGKCATNLKSASTPDGLRAAIKHYWRQPRIKGVDPKGKHTYDRHAIADLLQVFLKKNEKGAQEFVSILCESVVQEADRQSFLESLLKDKKIWPLVEKCFFELPADFDPTKLAGFEFVNNMLVDALITTNSWQIIGNLVQKKVFTLQKHYPELRQELIKNHSKDANFLLSKLNNAEIAQLFEGANLETIDWNLAEAIYAQIGENLSFIFPHAVSASDALKFFLYLSGQSNMIDLIGNWQDLASNLEKHPEFIVPFFKLYAPNTAETQNLKELVKNDSIRATGLKWILSEQNSQNQNLALSPYFIRIILQIEFDTNGYDYELLISCLHNGLSLGQWYPEIIKELLANPNAKGVKDFLKHLGLAEAKKLFSGEQTEEISWGLAKKLYELFGNALGEILQPTEKLSDCILMLLYLCGCSGCIDKITDWEKLLSERKGDYASDLVQRIIRDESTEGVLALSHIMPQTIAEALGTLEEAELFDTLNRYSDRNESHALSIALLLPDNSVLAKDFRRQRWDAIRAEIPYTVFDIESNGEKIREFAFLQDGERDPRSYEGEEQISSLLRRLNKANIIVGHNIKQWDLPILEKRGLQTNAFIWDTLEIELLLDPCRYAYSLLAKHRATEDTQLTDLLFWNQLYRLAQRPELCSELKSFLPDNIERLLKHLNTSPYKEFFENFARNNNQFFKDRVPLSQKTANELSKLVDSTSKGRVLLVAPRSLWPELAIYLPLSFPILRPEEKHAYRKISKDLVISSPPDSPLGKAVLLRFCEESSTPIIGNIPQYVSIDGGNDSKLTLGESVLEHYAIACDGPIDCVDIDVFDDALTLSGPYICIAAISNKNQDRFHKVKIGRDISFSELMEIDGCYPFKMAHTGCIHISKDEFKNNFANHLDGVFDKINKYTANIWIENAKNRMFSLYKNYLFEPALKELSSAFKVSNVLRISWERNLPASVRPPFVVSSEKTRDFDGADYRVNPNTPYRGRYWTAQVAFLKKIHEINPDIPFVFVTDTLEEDEYDALRRYIEYNDFFVVRERGGLKDLDLAFHKHHSVLILDKEVFAKDICSLKTDSAFCVVWDNMGTERLRIMWRNLPFDIKLSSVAYDEIEERKHHTTIAECIEVAWPMFIHYSAMLVANNTDSSFYVLDPAFDDFPGLSKQLGDGFATPQSFVLWESEEMWKSSYAVAQEYFSSWPGGNDDKSIDPIEAKKYISKMLISGGALYNYQEQVLDFMLQKQGDCIVSIPTGGGKSILFQGPALYRGYYTNKLSIVITPLRALMQDQVHNLEKNGFAACVDYINSDLSYAELCQIYRRIRSGGITLLYVTPERFRVKSFMKVLNERINYNNGLEYAIFDEAHCIAQWGNDFRPDYHNAYKKCEEWKEQYNITIALFSATITAQEEDEYRRILPNIRLIGQKRDDYNPIRHHIEMNFELIDHVENARFDKLVQFLRKWDMDAGKSRMIVFCRRQKDCEDYAAELDNCCSIDEGALHRFAGHIGYFHAGMEQLERNDTYMQFNAKSIEATKRIDNEAIYVLFATKAFGMGMDIPNIHYLMHMNPPSFLEEYLQEVGRAGRNEKQYEDAFPVSTSNAQRPTIPAVCLISAKDFKKLKELLQSSMLAWSHLAEARQKIVAYMEQFRTVKQCRTEPLVVPWNVWLKDQQRPDDTTASRLVFHWLEQAKRIRLGYLMPAHLDVTLKENNFSSMPSGYLLNVYHLLLKYIGANDIMSQIPIQEARKKLHVTMNMFMDSILKLEEIGFLELHSTIYCELTNRRNGEVRYAVQENTNYRYLALHIYFNMLNEILKSCHKNKTYEIDEDQREYYVKLLEEECSYESEELVKETIEINGKKKDILYMPWKKTILNLPQYTVVKKETFIKDIKRLGVRRMFLILAYTPGIKFKDDRSTQSLRVVTDEWRDFLPSLEDDCVKWLHFICTKENNTRINWSNEARIACLLKNGYNRFCIVLNILRRLGYIIHSPLLPNGIELYATEKIDEPLDDGLDQKSHLYNIRIKFDEQEQLKKARLACMNIFSRLKNKDDRNDFIRQYFQCIGMESYHKLIETFTIKTNLDHEEQNNVLKELNDEALKIAESSLNNEQKNIYEHSVQEHISVLAGPGSGKTHVLTLRCARLIYKEKVEPSQVLVMAYNRAVVVELRNRLDNLFAGLGLNRFARSIPVFTFHGLAKRCMGSMLDGVNTKEWDEQFKIFLEKNRNEFKSIFPQIKHILVDEFQDITKNRLDYLKELHDIYPDAKFFVIGDINQSIYGFDRVNGVERSSAPEEYARLLAPRPYYDAWNALLAPKEMTMFTNYRSYQKILDFSARYLPKGSAMPRSSQDLIEHEPHQPYVFEFKTTENDSVHQPWIKTIYETVSWAKAENDSGDERRRVRTVAVFFRTNAEVFNAFSQLRDLSKEGIRLRIQGQSICELWRKREFFEVINWMSGPSMKDKVIDLKDMQSDGKSKKTYGDIIDILDRAMLKYENSWDVYYLDVVKSLINHYVDSISADDKVHTFEEMAEYIKELTDADDGGQIYKIYDYYHKEDKTISVVLTTMHKIKGLEFDAVITIPSSVNLPMKFDTDLESVVNDADQADIEEEKRLMYVACTRAKKRLIVITGPREKALLEGRLYYAAEDRKENYYERKPGLSNYVLYYNASQYAKISSRDLLNIKANSPVTIRKVVRGGWCFYEIYSNDRVCIGQLSMNGSDIRKSMEKYGVNALSGFFISDVIAWRFEDSDKEDSKCFSNKWTEENKRNNYIYIPIISGMGKPV